MALHDKRSSLPVTVASLLLAIGGVALRLLLAHRSSEALPFRRPPRAALPDLRQAIVGNSKTAVASILGPPRIATFSDPGATHNYLEADMWYYPLRPQDRLGMVIQFAQDRADQVDFFDAPKE